MFGNVCVGGYMWKFMVINMNALMSQTFSFWIDSSHWPDSWEAEKHVSILLHVLELLAHFTAARFSVKELKLARLCCSLGEWSFLYIQIWNVGPNFPNCSVICCTSWWSDSTQLLLLHPCETTCTVELLQLAKLGKYHKSAASCELTSALVLPPLSFRLTWFGWWPRAPQGSAFAALF